jgi:type I restriction enzyme S subunit
MHEGLIDQDQKFKKRIASRDTSTYKVVHRRKLVVGFPIDEGVLGFQNKYDAAAVSPAYDIWEETGSHQIDLNYFERILRSPFARMIYASKMRGTTNRRRTVPKEIFKQIMFPLPPLEEQKRIAGILDAADSLRAKRRESLAKLDDLLQSTFLDMFGDPVTNPKGWEKVDLGQHAQLINGDRGTNYPSRENFVEKGIPFINAGHLSEGKIDFTKMNFISENRFNLLGSGKIKKHDILYCLRGSLGKSAIVQTEGKGAIASSLVIIRPAEILSVEYLYSYLDSSFGQREIRSFDNGSSQPNLSAANVKKYSFPLPPLDLQQRFAEIVSSVEEQKAKMRKHLEQLDDLFASLQQRAFRGDL